MDWTTYVPLVISALAVCISGYSAVQALYANRISVKVGDLWAIYRDDKRRTVTLRNISDQTFKKVTIVAVDSGDDVAEMYTYSPASEEYWLKKTAKNIRIGDTITIDFSSNLPPYHGRSSGDCILLTVTSEANYRVKNITTVMVNTNSFSRH
ncbi:hypothetical protein [Bombiscardovia coagulans]|uniref:Uncharacterized protein n=1 Tax=Bombiscardovia coagulans TaxID=686666 RepID=A0A261EVI6_9BIFI|nr:hypothetical protein [Bombiscardovia coagulans]OZG50884.1 hypothetical protein BOCO_0070 [Bombiscardovia coagulans]